MRAATPGAWPAWAGGSALAALAARAALTLGIAAAATAAPVDVTVTDAAGRPLAGAVVWVDSAAARAAARPLAGAEIVQQGKAFIPEVAVVTVGSAVDFPNRDTVRHHVYSFSPAKRFDLKLYVGTPEKPVVFDKPGIAVLGCNIHDNMVGWVVIVETPWFAKTDAQGRARLSEVPAGRHQLRTWHADFAVGAPALVQPLAVDAAPVQAVVRVGG
jgi:plastocyanin